MIIEKDEALEDLKGAYRELKEVGVDSKHRRFMQVSDDRAKQVYSGSGFL